MSRTLLLSSAALGLMTIAAAAQTAPADVAAAPIELEEIVVTANRTPTPAKEVGSAVTIITREELEQRQVRVVSDALRSVPGVSVNTTGALGNLTQLRVRGAESNHTLVLIDGVEVNSPANLDSSFDFANLLALDVERIEVLRGPQSALYGSDAVAGVVNIITRRGEGPARGSAFVEAGSRGTVAGGASVGGAKDRFDYFLSASGLRTDGFSSAAEWRGNSEKDGYENGTAFAKFGFQARDNLRFDFVGRASGYSSDSDDFGAVAAIDGDAETEGKTFLGRAQAKLDLYDGRWQQLFRVSGNHDEYDYFSNGALTGSYEGTKTKFDYQSTFDIRTDSLPQIAQSVTLAVDHEINEASVRSDFIDLDRTRDQTGLVGQYSVGFWDQLFLTGSIRHDLNEDFDDNTTYRLTGAYVVQQTGTKFRASWGTGIKDPSLYELYGSPGVYPVLPNPDLLPERSRGWDVGVDQSLFDNRVLIEATYFDQEIEDFITTAYTPTFESQYVNGDGRAQTRGIELGLTVRPLPNLSLRAAYTWLDGEDPDGNQLLRRPEHSASFNADLAFLDGRANVGVGLVYVGDREDLAFLPAPTYGSYRTTLDSYVAVNARGSYRIDDNKEIYARVENLFDEEYEETYTYGSPGRVAIAGMRVNF
ncbi:TonB-dependent receptor plug domain-containing protein [Terrihabitans sp. B22-R8]|uniref:TonB-dependent receptor plug domain-containing protein n=1 Tax=Terrihabitans sp. B22-R8 TaxID=3425128 RepID=UPI00403C044E